MESKSILFVFVANLIIELKEALELIKICYIITFNIVLRKLLYMINKEEEKC